MRYALLFLIHFVLSACATTPTGGDQSAADDTRVPDLNRDNRSVSRSGDSTDKRSETTNAEPAKPAIFAQFTRIDLPLTADLESVWALAHTASLEPGQLSLWQANGMRVGVIEAADTKAFREGLASAVGNRVQRLHGRSEGRVPLALSPPLAKPLRVQVLDALDTKPRSVVLAAPARCQFLLDLKPTEHGQMQVMLTPHHHVPRVTVAVRTPQEKMLDGVLFDGLTLRALLRRDDMLIIGMNRIDPPKPPKDDNTSPPAEPATDDDTSSDGEPNEGSTTPDEGAPDTVPAKPDRPGLHWLPNRLATPLLAATHQRRPVQMLLVVVARTVEPRAADGQ